MYVGKKFANTIFKDYLNNVTETVEIDEDGYGVFKVAPKSLSVWRKEED